MITLTSPAAGRLSLPRPFWMLWLGVLVNRSGAMVQPFLSVYLTRVQGFGIGETGAVMAVFGVGSVLSHVVAGRLADRFGRRVTLTGGMLATSASMVLMGAATGFALVAVTAFLLGLTIESYRPASQAMVADLVPPSARPRAYGLLFWGVNLGYAVAMVAGGWFADRGATAMFGVNAAVAVVFAVLVWRAVPESRPEAAAESGAWRLVLRDPLMLAFSVVTTAYGAMYAQAFTTLPLAMAGQGITGVHFGLVMALNGVLIVVVQPLAGERLSRLDPNRVLAAGAAVVATGFALTAFVHDAGGLAVTVVIWTAGEIAVAGSIPTIVSLLSPPALQGTYAGLSGMSWSVGAVLAPVLGSFLLPFGPGALWGGVGLVGMAAAFGATALGGPVRRRVTFL
ncbi:MFS transporter [Amycolatopsis sp. EV170708-02-1]|uniref:MFS transporter n=1 Tax=Amycolatopsis sp. EV170708-02-1 TaxID=2919322 RepID=UPI001F0CAD96|nr:MFS transporter [Amycolatopsis sp. EV170708-02-1]UMP04655.1 MFS transporter [Amycolatopsis sp. EV170708-02-1]